MGTPSFENVIKYVAQELQRNIFERKGRAVKQLEHVQASVRMDWRHLRVFKGLVTLPDQLRERIGFDVVNEERHDLACEFAIRKPCQDTQSIADIRDGSRHEETPVGCQPGHHRIGKGQICCATARTDVSHGGAS